MSSLGKGLGDILTFSPSKRVRTFLYTFERSFLASAFAWTESFLAFCFEFDKFF